MHTITADSLHDASESLRASEVNVLSIEAVSESPRRYEPDGQRPGPVPRDGVELSVRHMPGGWVLAGIGIVFTAAALILVLTGLGLVIGGNAGGLFLMLFPLIHLLIGVGTLWYVFGRRRRRLRIYRMGEVAMATIDGVGQNRSIKVNGRNPYEMTWSFDVDGHRFHDKKSSFDERLLDFAPGDRLWVLYDPADPEESVEWPPFMG